MTFSSQILLIILLKLLQKKQKLLCITAKQTEAYYGKPDEATFSRYCRKNLTKSSSSSSARMIRNSTNLCLKVLLHSEEASQNRFKPQPETVARFSEIIQRLFADPFSHIPEDQTAFTPEETASITNEILCDELGGDSTDYHATVDPERANASVDHNERLIVFPEPVPRGIILAMNSKPSSFTNSARMFIAH